MGEFYLLFGREETLLKSRSAGISISLRSVDVWAVNRKEESEVYAEESLPLAVSDTHGEK